MRILFDECMTPRVSRLLMQALQMHKPPVEAAFLSEYLRSGLQDQDWTRTLADQGDWTVITTDYRNPKGSKARLKGPPLNILLPARGITGFFLVGRIAQRTGFEKMRAVLYCFPAILDRIESHPPGTRFRIREVRGRHYHLRDWPLVDRSRGRRLRDRASSPGGRTRGA